MMFDSSTTCCRSIIRASPMLPASRFGSVLFLLLGSLVVLALTGCASTRPPATSSTADDTPAEATAQQLRTETERWEGTPYILGGTTRRGIDCSAFVQALYRDVLETPLPRTTRQQANTGRAVPVNDAQPGDLVFFRPADKQRHVGVYLGDGEFAHASTSQGVTVSRMEAPYWESSYWMTRRLLSPSLDTAPPADLPTEAPTARRAGW